MVYDKQQAIALVIEAGHRLVSSGLIARTWGNVSARISQTQFVITPSGRAYDTLTPADIVTVNITDCAWEGEVKPSSEKGVHAECYRLRPEVNFVIHTHQLMATAVGAVGKDLAVQDDVLGDMVPCAAYGISSTKKLKRRVSQCVQAHPSARAFFMRCHGALCLGANEEEAFAAANRLEELCRVEVERRVTLPEKSSFAESDALRGQVDAPCLLAAPTPAALALSRRAGATRPVIDDMAQISGTALVCLPKKDGWERAAARELKKRAAVLVQDTGALCVGTDASEAEAVASVLEKNALSLLYARACGVQPYLGRFDALLQRTIYVKKYARLKK